MKKIIRENFVLAAGICLPLILVIIFWLATYVPTLFVDPPQYDFLYTTQNYIYNNPDDLAIKVDTVEDQVRIRAAARWSDDDSNRYNNPKIYRFYARTGQSIEISYADAITKQVPKEYFSCVKPSATNDQAQAQTSRPNATSTLGECPNKMSNAGNDYFAITLPELQNIKLYKGQIAPDGYNAEYGGYQNRSIFSELFYSSGGNSDFRIVKNGRSYVISSPAPGYRYDYGNTKFLGWIRKD